MICIENIILIGMSLCGKTTIGKLLSKKANLEYIDTDKLIELQENMTIVNIFNNYGESYFREKEKDIISLLKQKKNTIISAGGGMPAFYDNMDKLNQIGITIFLDVPLSVIIKRSGKDNLRPLLLNKCEAEIKALYEERIQFYKKAQITVNAGEMNKNEIVNIILDKLAEIK